MNNKKNPPCLPKKIKENLGIKKDVSYNLNEEVDR